MNTELTLDILDETEEFATNDDMPFFDEEWEMEDPAVAAAKAIETEVADKMPEMTDKVIVAAVAVPSKTKKAPAKKAKKDTSEAPKAKAPKAETPVEADEKPERSGAYVGQNYFDRLRSEGKSSTGVIWQSLLTDGTAEVLYASEFAVMNKSELAIELASRTDEAAVKAAAKLHTAARNRMSQRVQQPFTQQWYVGNGGASGVFGFSESEFKNGKPKSLIIEFVDTDRPPLLVSAAGRITKVGRVALDLIADGVTSFECGITDDDVDALVELAGIEAE